MDTSVTDDNWGEQHHQIFHSGKQFLIHTAMKCTLLAKNCNEYFTLRYNWGVWHHYDLMMQNV